MFSKIIAGEYFLANYYNKDLYKVLNLTYKATKEEIKSAYRKLVMTCHPDVSSDENNTKKFQEIKEAYDILLDDNARKKYDILHGYFREKLEEELKKSQKKQKDAEYIKKAKEKANTSEPFSKAMNEALDSLFKTKTKKNSQDYKKPVNGSDINVDITVTFNEAVNGTNRKVNILHTQPCPNCEGRKFINGNQCPMCKGLGTISAQKSLNVKIPKDVKQGSKVRVRKEGNKGLYGGKDGDLYLIINIEKNPYFETDGLDIICTLPITPYEAVLGAEVTIPAPGGNASVKIPPMTSSGQKLKLSGLGLTNKSKTKTGDMIIKVLIKLPDKLNGNEIELYKKLSEISNSDIRKDMKNAK